MKTASRIVFLTAIALALAYWVAGSKMEWPMQSIIKAAPIYLLAGLAWVQSPREFRLPLSLAFLFSGMGDWALSAPFANSFLLGMGAFFLAQLCLIWTFAHHWRPLHELDLQRWLAVLLIAVFAIALMVILLPHSGAYALPAGMYYLAVSTMAIMAFLVRVPRLTRLGALLFLLSDSLIGLDKFLAPIEHRQLLVMGTYYLAQFLIFAGLVRLQLRKQKS